MLSIAKINGADGKTGRYYTSAVATGVEDYYTGRGEADGRWIGAGSAALDLAGETDHDHFHAVLNARDPRSGSALRVAPRDVLTGELREGVVRGLDLTFSAPKSVSVVYAAGDARVAREVRDAVDHATDEAVAWLEQRACVLRRGHGGAIEVPGEGFVGAAFRHRTSRAGDPQLHTHVVIANMARGEDGRWSALHASHIYAHARTAGFVFQAVMRHELSRRLRVHWRDSPTPGVYEIAGVPFELMRELSKRRQDVETAMAEAGVSGPAAARVASVATRPPKDHQLDNAAGLHDSWRALAGERGFDQDALEAIFDQGRNAELDPATIDRETQRILSAAGLTEKASVFSNQMVVRAWAQAAVDGATIAQLDDLAALVLAHPDVVELPATGTLGEVPEPLSDAGASRDAVGDARLSGHDEAGAHGGREGGVESAALRMPEVFRGRQRYTTRELLDVERDLLARAQAGADAQAGVCWTTTVQRVLDAAPTASTEQAAMVRALALDGARVALVRAPAGAGKTWTLNLARQAWQQEALPVLGVALARRAASELGQQAQLDYATSITRLLMDVEREGRLPDRAVLVVDEAAMVGTRTIHQLLGLVEDVDGKLVLVGDEHQLPEIDAGGAFRGLAERLGAIELTDNFRQQDPLERVRVRALRHGASASYLHTGMRTGQIVFGIDAQQTRQLMLHDWHNDHHISQPGEALMLARANSDVAWLNDGARHLLKRDGELAGPELTVAERSFAVGDIVIGRRNLPGGIIDNGTRAQVVALDFERQRLTVRPLGQDRDVVIEHGYLAERHLHHGYALTVHLAEGMTVDRVRVLHADSIPGRELVYTSGTRHRFDAHVYLTAPSALRFELPDDRDPLASIINTIGAPAAKRLALDTTIDSTVHGTTSTAELRARRDVLCELLHTYPTQAGREHEHHARQLTRAEAQRDAARARVRDLSDQLDGAPAAQREQLGQALARASSTLDAWNREYDTHRAALDETPGRLRPGDWLQRNAPAVRELATVEAVLHARERSELQAQIALALHDPDSALSAQLGERPLDQRPAQAWDHAVRAVTIYRYHLLGQDPGHGLVGPQPLDPDDRVHWERASRAIDDYRRSIDAPHRSITPTALDLDDPD